MMHITEDTPPDMLAGAMDLTVHLPTGRSVKMSVERSTPMMDLLVQIVTAHQLQLSGHIIQALEMAPSAGLSDKVLPYKPNTPIGALDTQHIKVVPKNRNICGSKNIPSGHQPFESTFRLKVHLPRNQLYVTRVSQNVYLEDIMNKVCKEKDLDPSKYEFRHPGNLDEVLDPKLTLSDYQITEIYVVAKGTGRLTQAFSTSDIMALRKEEERKQFQVKTGGGVFNLIFKRGKSNAGNGSISSDNRSISPTHSDDSRSVTPPAIQSPAIIKEPPSERPKPPQRKRRPAPKPPQVSQEVKVEKPPSQISNNSNQSDGSAKKGENGLLICHSRNSSDSSGYHEASILSDNCNTSLPRRPRTMIDNVDANDSKLSGEHSKSTGNLTKTSVQYKSTSSLALHGRKKKAAPPPPPLTVPKPETPITKPEITSPVVASQPVENLPESVSTVPTNQTPPESISSSILPQSTTTSATTSTTASARASLSNLHNTNSDKIPEVNVKELPKLPPEKTEDINEENIQTESEISALLSESKNEADSGICEKEDLELETVWQYQLPSPPKAFRDASPAVPTTISQYDTETLPDSVVTNPDLFEKLQFVKDIQDAESDIPSVISDDEKEICSKLTLEHLEKRKSLVYNRELATSLKFAQENDSDEKKSFTTINSNVINELEDTITNTNNNKNSDKENITNTTSKIQETFKTTTLDRNLPNFQISSYDTKKEKINIFEDDTIRSNVNLSHNNSHLKTTLAKIENTHINNLNITQNTTNLDRTDASSIENISALKNSKSSESNNNNEEIFKKPQEISVYRLKNSFYDKNKNINAKLNSNNVNRSGSFSVNSENWTPSIPVKRSKSQIALNKYKEENADITVKESLSKSNSLLDVSSSLQSLEVMKKIQNKLSSSKEEIDINTEDTKTNSNQDLAIVEQTPSPPKTISPPINTTTNWSPPTINLGTWSQRPKTQVMLKEDTDYKFNSVSAKINSINYGSDTKTSTLKSTSSFSSYKPNTINITNSYHTSNGVSIKVNGSEPISSQKPGNVVIKIGESDSGKDLDSISSRFINHITPGGYRKPLGNVNKIDRTRPHSIAFDNQFDISRVPVVRSVELKKPFKDLHTNKSITQIYSNNIKINDDEPKSLNYSNSCNYDSDLKSENKHSNIYLSNESINKPVFRNNSFTPVVKGFRTENSTSVNRKVWSVYGTLPTKPADHQPNTSNNVSFSQMNLRRTESNKVLNSSAQNSNSSNSGNIFSDVVLRNNSRNFKTVIQENIEKTREKAVAPPPPPQIPKENSTKLQTSTERIVDPRAELLSAIRSFGGKKGLRATKG